MYVDYREDNGKPFYVGKGVEKRVKDLHRNQLHTNIKNKHGMVRKIVLETQSEQEAFEKEVELIQELKTHIDFGEGGANFTLGGDGVSGYKHSEEQNIKKSEASKRRWDNPDYKEKWREIRKKIFDSPEFKEKMSEATKKMWEDPEQREKLKVVFDSPEFKEKVGKSSRKRWEDPEFRAKHLEACKKKSEDPEYKEKVMLGAEKKRLKLNDPEIKKKMSNKAKERNANRTPEQRSEIVRKAWETRRLKKLQQES